MVRRRGRARRSYAYLRIKKYRLKWTHEVIPERFKLLVKPMEAKVSEHLTLQDAVETQTIVECENKGVPTSEYPHYLAFAKRCYKTYMTVWYLTAEYEIDNLVNEFIQRGKDALVLDQLRDIMRDKAGIARGIKGPPAWNYNTLYGEISLREPSGEDVLGETQGGYYDNRL